MDVVNYLDFDLLIQRVETGYRAQVVNSPAGQTAITFSTPFSDLELENFLLRVGRPLRGTRRVDSPEVEAAKTFGQRLFAAVFGDEVRACLRSSLDEASRQGAGLRVRLRLTEVPELADLPWEYLYNPALNRFLALSVETPLVRYLDLPERIRPLAVTPPLRVLVMISSPSDYPRLDVEREWAKLREALGDWEKRGLLTLERLEDATLAAFQRQLRRGEYHISHFIGHGGFDQRTQDGILILEDEEGRGRPVSGQDLGTLLHDHRPMRLAILNACEGARASRTDPFAGVAQSLVQQGIPAVIAMQFEITDEAAITFAHEFYGAVADGYPVDAALAEARKAIFAQGNSLEWGTPVLYLRSPDGVLFSIQKQETEGKKQAEAKRLEQERQEREEREKAARDEAERKAREERKRQEQIANLYNRALELSRVGQWQEALEEIKKIQTLDPQFADSEGIVARVQEELAREAERLEQERREREAREKAAREEAEGKPSEEELKREPDKGKARRTSLWVYGALGVLIVLVLLIVGLWKWNKSKVEQALLTKGVEYYKLGNYFSALPLFQQLAEAGNAKAMSYLGYMYQEGLGVESNYGQSVYWSTKAAEAGEAEAMNNLGYAYEKGLGVEKDYNEAVSWYRKAASLGDEDAKIALKRLEELKVPPPKILDFSAEPSTIKEGEASNLRWNTSNAKEVEISGIGKVSFSDSMTVSPTETTTYTLIARNEKGKTVEREVTVKVDVQFPSPEILYLGVNSKKINKGNPSTVEWKTSNADEVTLVVDWDKGVERIPVKPSGSKTYYPGINTTYTLIAKNEEGKKDERTITVEVASVPIPKILIKFVAEPSAIKKGEVSTLRWSTSNAKEVEISSIGKVSLDGSKTVSPTETTTYTLIARSGGGKTVEREVTVKVAASTPEILKPPTPRVEEEAKSLMVQHPERYIKITDWSFFVAFNGVATINHVVIENIGDVTYKDIKVRVRYYSRAAIGVGRDETKTLPVTIPPHSRETYLEGGFVLGAGTSDIDIKGIDVLGAVPLK